MFQVLEPSHRPAFQVTSNNMELQSETALLVFREWITSALNLAFDVCLHSKGYLIYAARMCKCMCVCIK